MSVQYQAVQWNPQKKAYDLTLLACVVLYLGLFVGVGAVIHPNATAETLLIRGLGTGAFLLLHVILSIGPLCRLDTRFLPLLYNRRHLGVTMFLLALAHGAFSLIQFHALGNVNPLESLFTSNTRYDSLAQFPFQQLGFFALLILFLMAATSHDFWLRILGAQVWKRLHMIVYAVYALLLAHVSLGALQSEKSLLLALVMGAGLVVICGLHVAAALHEQPVDSPRGAGEEFVAVARFDSIPDKRAIVITLGNERVAVFRHDNKVSALSNVCRHQGGPLGEGRIVDGCITCPWHGYQYLPGTGASPPPFTEKVATFATKVVDGQVYVCPRAKS
ncbi:MAG: ferric reductase-like transmembrane domain-containing protein [Acidobacteria bacterium]|nr:ferric reductase-like transmembrane domain-containing protein [Acidobacteriota bacterium]